MWQCSLSVWSERSIAREGLLIEEGRRIPYSFVQVVASWLAAEMEGCKDVRVFRCVCLSRFYRSIFVLSGFIFHARMLYIYKHYWKHGVAQHSRVFCPSVLG